MLHQKRATVIYTKQIKERLEREYNILPIAVIPHPYHKQWNAYVFTTTDYFSEAMKQISDKDGKKNGPDSQNKQEH